MISTLWASKFSTMWRAWSWKREGHGDGHDQAFSKYNITKKKLWMEFLIFNVSYRFLMKVARHSQSTRKGILLNFSNILRKSIATASVFYCDARHLDTLLGSNHVCRYLFLGGCGQEWAWSFRSWNSEIFCTSKTQREWIDKIIWFFLHVDTILGKLMLI